MNAYFQQANKTSLLRFDGVLGKVLWKVDAPVGTMVVGGQRLRRKFRPL